MTIPKLGDFILLTPALKLVQNICPNVLFTVPEPLFPFYQRENILRPNDFAGKCIDHSYPLLDFLPRRKGAHPTDRDIFTNSTAPKKFRTLRTTLENVADILSGSLFHVDNDSGINHLTGALDVPTISIWGFTAPGTWSSLSRRQYTLWGGPSWESHCGGARAAIYEHKICLELVKVSDIMPAVKEHIQIYKSLFF